jgi:hypothetical protein
MNILILLLIPVIIAVTGFLVLKSVQLGLKWQIQTTKQEQPTLEIKNPIQPIVEAKQEKEQSREQENILNEWLNGPQESR